MGRPYIKIFYSIGFKITADPHKIGATPWINNITNRLVYVNQLRFQNAMDMNLHKHGKREKSRIPYITDNK
jgi:hypothetical protein